MTSLPLTTSAGRTCNRPPTGASPPAAPPSSPIRRSVSRTTPPRNRRQSSLASSHHRPRQPSIVRATPPRLLAPNASAGPRIRISVLRRSFLFSKDSSMVAPAPPAASDVPRDPVPRNPIPLSAGQEQQVRDLYYKRVRSFCADEIRDFASCALNRTVSATWACRQQRMAMNSCMVVHATQDEMDKAREEWFATRELRKREREEKEKKRIEQEKFHREWWGLDEQGRRKLDAEKK